MVGSVSIYVTDASIFTFDFLASSCVLAKSMVDESMKLADECCASDVNDKTFYMLALLNVVRFILHNSVVPKC